MYISPKINSFIHKSDFIGKIWILLQYLVVLLKIVVLLFQDKGMMNLKRIKLSGCIICLMILLNGCTSANGLETENTVCAETESGFIKAPFEKLYIGFCSDRPENDAPEKSDLTQAMINCGMEENQMITINAEYLEKDIETLLNQCQLIVISANLGDCDIVSIAEAHPDVQFMIQSQSVYEADNIITYYIDRDEVKHFVHKFEAHMTEHHIPNCEQYLEYEISYGPIFEDVITVFAEMKEVKSDVYHWSVDEGCIEFKNIKGSVHENEVQKVLNELMTKEDI